MAGAYSQDVPDRVIDAVIGGKISRRAAAARFGVSLSSAIKWVQRFERTGSRGAATMAGYKRVKVEPRRGVSRGSAGRETRHHAHGAVREAFNRARRQGGHLDDEPVPPPDRRHAQTKTLIARARPPGHPPSSAALARLSEARRPLALARSRRELNQDQSHAALRALAPRGERFVDTVRHGHWNTATFLAALRNTRIEAPCLFDGPINGERFRA